MTRRHPARRPGQAGALVLVAVAALLALATPAQAHVGAEASTDGTGVTRVVLSFDHGCEGQPTTTLRARAPEGATDVVAEPVDGWEAAVEGSEVVWRGGSVPDGQSAEFAFTALLAQPDGAEVAIPVIQECPSATNEWIEPPTDDQSEASSPAPVIVVPVGAGERAAAAETGPAETPEPLVEPAPTATVEEASQALPDGAGDPSTAETEQASADDESAAAGGTAGLVVFLVVMAVILGGGVLLYLRNRRPTPGSP